MKVVIAANCEREGGQRSLADDTVCNVTSVQDTVNTKTITYTYDELDRLTSASLPSGEAYAYNAIGNLTSKGGLSLTYPASGSSSVRPHAVSSYNGSSFAYDANGSMTTRGSQTIVYDALRRPVRADQGGVTIARYAYDGDGGRRKRLDTHGTVHYVSTDFENNVGTGLVTAGVVTKYVSALGRLVALRRGGALRYVGTDHAGSTTRVSDASFSALDQMRYTPFGVARDGGTNLGTDRLYRGMTWDAAAGWYWDSSRAYDPGLGRFLQPDTVVPSAAAPQTLNRYSYANNNPLKFIDPTGHVALTGDDEYDYTGSDDGNMGSPSDNGDGGGSIGGDSADPNSSGPRSFDDSQQGDVYAAIESQDDSSIPAPPPDTADDDSLIQDQKEFNTQPANASDYAIKDGLLIVAKFGDVTGNNIASDYLDHYLDGTGTPKTIEMNDFMSRNTGFASDISNTVSSWESQAASGQFGNGASLTAGWQQYSLDVRWGDSPDWHAADGGIRWSMSAVLTIDNQPGPDGNIHGALTYEVFVRDTYEWQRSGGGPSQAFRDLNTTGLAQAFGVSGNTAPRTVGFTIQ